ncbi:MAG: metal-dependent hydrolase [Pirellulales bacterium]
MATIDNLPVRTVEHGGLTIEGYSRAAVQSYWRIPELDVGFDLGGQPLHFAQTGNWFVSHCHLDHVAAIPMLVSRRRKLGLTPPRIYLPRTSVCDIEALLRGYAALDGGQLPCELIGLADREDVELSPDHVVTAFATQHTVPSLGFLVWKRSSKLTPSIQNGTERETRPVSVSGLDTRDERRYPLVCYVGDSAPAGLDHFQPLFEAQILITELTFVEPAHRRDRVHKYGHIHLDDLEERASNYHNELIIAAHLTARTSRRRAEHLLDQRLPASLRERLQLWA